VRVGPNAGAAAASAGRVGAPVAEQGVADLDQVAVAQRVLLDSHAVDVDAVARGDIA
jgi:hypothetical protein